jgi:hypothetical protein
VTLAADIYNFQSAAAGLWVSGTQLVGTKVTDLSSSTGGLGEHAQSTDGSRPGGQLPGGTCVLVGFVIARRYRGGKPRSYFPWGSETDLNIRQQWFPELTNAVDSGLATYFSSVIGTTVGSLTITEHVNISYYEGFTSVQNPVTHRWRNIPTPRAVPLVDNILSFSASLRPSSQRRRN